MLAEGQPIFFAMFRWLVFKTRVLLVFLLIYLAAEAAGALLFILDLAPGF